MCRAVIVTPPHRRSPFHLCVYFTSHLILKMMGINCPCQTVALFSVCRRKKCFFLSAMMSHSANYHNWQQFLNLRHTVTHTSRTTDSLPRILELAGPKEGVSLWVLSSAPGHQFVFSVALSPPTDTAIVPRLRVLCLLLALFALPCAALWDACGTLRSMPTPDPTSLLSVDKSTDEPARSSGPQDSRRGASAAAASSDDGSQGADNASRRGVSPTSSNVLSTTVLPLSEQLSWQAASGCWVARARSK